MAISRSNMERQLRNMGGIMSLQEPRQGYFLGKIVKKAKRAVKKVVKSPIGKAAILAAPFLMGGAGAGGLGSIFGKAKGCRSLLETRQFRIIIDINETGIERYCQRSPQNKNIRPSPRTWRPRQTLRQIQRSIRKSTGNQQSQLANHGKNADQDEAVE